MASHKVPVAVIGLGRFGTALALELARGGTEVLAVDHRPDVVQNLSGQLGQVVIANSTDPDALTEIGIADFPRGGGHLQRPGGQHPDHRASGRAGDPRHLGEGQQPSAGDHPRACRAHHVVFPEQDMSERIAHLVAGRLRDWVELDPEWVFAKTKPPRELVGVPLGETGLRKKHRVTVVSVKPESQTSYTHADYATVLT